MDELIATLTDCSDLVESIDQLRCLPSTLQEQVVNATARHLLEALGDLLDDLEQ